MYTLMVQRVIGCCNINLHILITISVSTGASHHALDHIDGITCLSLLEAPKGIVRGMDMLLNTRDTDLGSKFKNDL